MIASENFVPTSILECQGSVLTNKYAEGLPGKRYYGGCEYVDMAETMAIERAKRCSAPARQRPAARRRPGQRVAYSALLEPGDTILGLDLSHGGHLTHGMQELLGQASTTSSPTTCATRTRSSTWTRWRAWPRSTAQDDHRRVVGLSPPSGLRAVPRDRRRRRRLPAHRHGPLRRARGGRAAPQPGAARPRRHHDDPQDARRRPRRDDPAATTRSSPRSSTRRSSRASRVAR